MPNRGKKKLEQAVDIAHTTHQPSDVVKMGPSGVKCGKANNVHALSGGDLGEVIKDINNQIDDFKKIDVFFITHFKGLTDKIQEQQDKIQQLTTQLHEEKVVVVNAKGEVAKYTAMLEQQISFNKNLENNLKAYTARDIEQPTQQFHSAPSHPFAPGNVHAEQADWTKLIMRLEDWMKWMQSPALNLPQSVLVQCLHTLGTEAAAVPFQMWEEE